MLYLLDSNVLIDAHRDYYSVDRVPEFWDWLASMGEQARVKVPLEAYEEVVAGKEDSLTIWLKDNKINLMLDEQVDVEIVRRIVEEGYAADLTDDEIEQARQRSLPCSVRPRRWRTPCRSDNRSFKTQ